MCVCVYVCVGVCVCVRGVVPQHYCRGGKRKCDLHDVGLLQYLEGDVFGERDERGARMKKR